MNKALVALCLIGALGGTSMGTVAIIKEQKNANATKANIAEQLKKEESSYNKGYKDGQASNEAVITDYKNNLQILRSQLNTIKAERDTNVEKVKELDSSLTELQTKYDENATKLEELKATNSNQAQAIADLEEQQTVLNNRITALNTEKNSLNDSISSLNSRISKLDSEIQEKNDIISGIENGEKFVISFFAGGNIIQRQIVDANVIPAYPTVPTIEGREFTGTWMINGQVIDKDTYIICENVNIVAVFKAQTLSVRICAEENPDDLKYTSTLSVEYGSNLSEDMFTTEAENMVLDYLKVYNPNTHQYEDFDLSTPITSSIYVYPVFRSTQHTFHFNCPGIAEVYALEGSSIKDKVPTAPVCAGYTFKGWSTTRAFEFNENMDIMNFDEYIVPQAGASESNYHTFYPIYEITDKTNVYTVNFISSVNNSVLKTIQIPAIEDSTINTLLVGNLPYDNVPSGYEFTGYKVDGEYVYIKAESASQTTLKINGNVNIICEYLNHYVIECYTTDNGGERNAYETYTLWKTIEVPLGQSLYDYIQNNFDFGVSDSATWMYKEGEEFVQWDVYASFYRNFRIYRQY